MNTRHGSQLSTHALTDTNVHVQINIYIICNINITVVIPCIITEHIVLVLLKLKL